MDNEVIQAMMNRKSIRKYTEQMPSEEVIQTVALEHGEAPQRVEADLSKLVQDLESEGLVRLR